MYLGERRKNKSAQHSHFSSSWRMNSKVFVDFTSGIMKKRSSGVKLLYVKESWLGTLRMLAIVAYCIISRTYCAGSCRAQTSKRIYFLSTRSLKVTLVGVLSRIVNFLIYFPMSWVFLRLSRSDSSSSKVYHSRKTLSNKVLRFALTRSTLLKATRLRTC